MLKMIAHRIGISFVIVAGYMYFTLVLMFDIAMTKTNDAVPAINGLSYILPYLIAITWASLIYPIALKPVGMCIAHRTRPMRMRKAHKYHAVSVFFSKSKARVGWFGVLRFTRLQKQVHIATNAGTIWHGDKYAINAFLMFYLKAFRGYKKSNCGDFLFKSIVQP
ncbi:hypothetical protein VCHA53O466_140075 [Vibrio chagasii]|nr:hypothetical protein VCHA53O466_140075 [Vibrio chagasii]